MNNKNRIIEEDFDKTDEAQHEVTREINRIKKSVRRRGQKAREYCKLSLRLNELNKIKTEIRNNTDALKQIFFKHWRGKRSSYTLH